VYPAALSQARTDRSVTLVPPHRIVSKGVPLPTSRVHAKPTGNICTTRGLSLRVGVETTVELG
jgi:hypothetical protein